MTSVVNDSCIKCRACIAVCPVDAFHEGDDMMVVNPDTCIDCGACIPECPVSAIADDTEADSKWTEFNAEKSKEWPNVTA